MIIIVGAGGQIGSNVVRELEQKQLPIRVRAIVHKSAPVFSKSVEVMKTELLNKEEVIEAFKGGSTIFLLTPERPDSNEILEETKIIIENYKTAIKNAGAKKIVCLSCGGAQIEKNTGNILMSRMLEQSFSDMEIEKIFVRPSYYYSNWLGYLDLMKNAGILPTFFPADLKVEMHSPLDVAKFITKCILNDKQSNETTIYELGGEKYSTNDIANSFSKKLNKEITVQVVPIEDRIQTLMSVGFTHNTAQNMSDMTQAVIDNVSHFEFEDKVIKLPTTFDDYLESVLKML
ncbi:NmrA family NAD(P)-binding protein [Proteiniphilum sp. UBA5384]|uniref:NmrA family NAD(P)-binding protein n=1 Tax=Proteiniphilum sp. UBA5384 TaxID=1947279 RepID=UPI0025E58FAC|nr:NmrA family NAD(P)-binding protein [Proteiniphilum sp. UBA5384]